MTAPDCYVWGEPELLITAIRNLIGNAVAYSDPHTRVAIRVSSGADDLVLVAVTDQGQGIPASDQQRIFERFYRVDEARSRATGGTGLGLAIVKHVCENHGGEVTVWSEPGRGSTFTMRLPSAAVGRRRAAQDRLTDELPTPGTAPALRARPSPNGEQPAPLPTARAEVP